MDDVITKILARNICNLRLLHGYTQKQVASKIGMSRATYNALENGKRDIAASELASIAAFYDMTAPELFGTHRDNNKFKQMYFYILSHFKDGVPKTKLAKLLYLADFRNFYENLRPMSGVYYIRKQYGPLADCFLEMTDELYDDGKITIDKLSEGAFLIKSNTREADFSLLSEEDRRIMDEICDLWKEKPTREIVNYTHEQKPWASCRDGEYIPYELIIQEDPRNVYAPLS